MSNSHGQERSATAIAEACARTMYENDRSSKRLGIVVDDVKPGYAEACMEVRRDMLDADSTCHQGVIFTLADTAFAYACNTYDEVTVAASCTIEYLNRPGAGEKLIAIAQEQWRRGRNGVCDVRVSDRSGRSIAIFRGKSFSMGTPLINSEQET